MNSKIIYLISLFFIITALTGCSSKEKTSTGGYNKISAQQAKEMMDKDSDVIILDVRTLEEYNTGHIEGAILITDTEILDKAKEILTNPLATILVYCRSGRRSALAANALVKLGYSNVYDFGGIIDWTYDITKDDVHEQESLGEKEVLDKQDNPAETKDNLYVAYKTIDDMRLYGFINNKGEFVIEPKYQYASDFHEDLAIIFDNNTHCVMDTTGRIIFENDDLIYNYKNGTAIYEKTVDYNTLKGYVDNKGDVIIKPKYTWADDFNEKGTAIVGNEDGTFFKIDKEDKVLDTYVFDKNYTFKSGFIDGFAVISDYSGDTEKNFVINLDGNIVIEPINGEILNLHESLFSVKVDSDFSSPMLDLAQAAIFNGNGEQLTDYINGDLSRYNTGFASATDDKYTYFVDKSGNQIGNLPKLEGRGTLLMINGLIKAEIDNELMYLDQDSNIIWKADTSYYLSNSIVVNRLKYKQNKYALIHYPLLEGLEDKIIQNSINSRLNDLFLNQRSDDMDDEYIVSIDDDFTAHLQKDLLTIFKTGYDYPIGAAHGMPIQEYYFINIKSGKFYQLSDLFKDDSFSTALNEIIKNKIQEQISSGEAMFFEDGFSEISKEQHFYLTEDSLIIYFYPYDISAYALGFPEFKIPFSQISDLLNYEGGFWNSFSAIGSLNQN